MNIKIEQYNTNTCGLAWSFHVSPSSCAHPEYYDEYIRLCAGGDQRTGVGVTSLLVDTDANRIVGYITLRASSLVRTDSDSGKKLVCPALEIAELAVDKDYERHGFGTVLLGISVDMAAELRSKIGIRYIVVCSDPSSVGFYKNNSLVKFEEISSVYEFLHDGWNNNCVPLYVALPEIQ